MQLYHTIHKMLRVAMSVTILTVLLTGAVHVFANDLIIEDLSIVEPDQFSGTINIRFNISWDNSWRNSINHDAVWLFAKYSIDGGESWRHATLSDSGRDPEGFSTGSNSALSFNVPADKKGCFLKRATSGAGELYTEGAEISWSWAEDGLSSSDVVSVKLFGIEMVYVPRGNFYAGDGNGTDESTYAFHRASDPNSAVRISSSNVHVTCANNINDDMGSYWVTVKGPGGVNDNPDYPTGYAAFYMMKYQVTEGDWVNFVNTLTPEARANRDITGPTGKDSDGTVYRNTVSYLHGEAMSARPDRAMSFLSWADLCAYAAWAGLRPMTELEYEKAARGSGRTPMVGEFAWGNAHIIEASEIAGPEDGTEKVSTPGANVNYNEGIFSGGDGGEGPLRVGIFATRDSDRMSAGAGFYGAMELSGNLRERSVSLGNPEGRSFRGSHGTGELSEAEGSEGSALNSDWPGYESGHGVIGAEGSGFRGGSWLTTDPDRLAISDRSEASIASPARLPDSGARAVRTAP